MKREKYIEIELKRRKGDKEMKFGDGSQLHMQRRGSVL